MSCQNQRPRRRRASAQWRRSIPAGLELAVDLPAVISLLSTLAPATLTDEAQTTEDGAGAPAAGADEDDMEIVTVTDAAPTEDDVTSTTFP